MKELTKHKSFHAIAALEANDTQELPMDPQVEANDILEMLSDPLEWANT